LLPGDRIDLHIGQNFRRLINKQDHEPSGQIIQRVFRIPVAVFFEITPEAKIKLFSSRAGFKSSFTWYFFRHVPFHMRAAGQHHRSVMPKCVNCISPKSSNILPLSLPKGITRHFSATGLASVRRIRHRIPAGFKNPAEELRYARRFLHTDTRLLSNLSSDKNAARTDDGGEAIYFIERRIYFFYAAAVRRYAVTLPF
jgi:hypothetical protein